MSDQSGFVYGTAKTLSTNTFGRAYTVTYDANGGSCGTSSATATYTFNGWKSSNGTSYADKASVSTFSPTPAHGATVTLTAQWTSASVTLPNATKDGAVLDGWYSGNKKIGDPGDAYTPTANITLTAKWISKYDFEITGDNYTINNEAWNKTGAFTFVHADEAHMTTTIQKPDVISYDRASNTITALKIGTSKITFTQNTSTTVNNGTIEYTITVDSVANTLAVSATSFTKYVDQEVVSVRSNQNSNGTITTTSSNPNLAHYDISNNKIVIPNSDAQNLPFDNVIITISQAATAKYKAKKHTITLTVNKYANAISSPWGANVWSKTVNFNEQISNVTFTATNTDYTTAPIEISQVNGNNIGSFNEETHEITAFHNIGYASWALHQNETYKYEEADAAITVTVNKIQDPGCDVTLYTALTESSKKVSETSDFDLGGVGVKLYLHIKTNGALGNDANLYYKTASSNWTYLQEVSAPTGGEADRSVNLPNGTTHIKFTKGGSLGTDDPYIKNIVVTRTHYFDIENEGGSAITSLTMPQNTPTNKVKTATFYVDYSTCADKIKLVSSHSRIKFTANNSTTYEFSTTPNHYGRQAIEVSYTSPSFAEVLHETITIYTPYENKVLNINAETIGKLATHLVYIGNASYPVDMTNIAASALFEVRDANDDLVENATIALASNSDNAPIADNMVNPECGGNATITASFAGDDTYEAAQDFDQTITITKLEDEVKIMLPSVLVVNDEYVLSGLATAKSGTNITFISGNTSILKIENGKLIVKSKGSGSVTLTATSAGNCTYNSVSEEIELTIRELTDPCNTLLLDDVHKANLGAYNGYTLLNPKKYEIADGPKDKLTYKAWKVLAATQDFHLVITNEAITDAADLILEIASPKGNILKEIVYHSNDLPTSKDKAINGTVDMIAESLQNAKYMYAYATDDNYILAGTLYKYISNVKITQQSYLTGSTGALTMPTVTACDTAKAEFTLDYSDVGPIRLSASQDIEDGLTYEVWKNGVKIDDFDNNCGDYGMYTVKLFYVPLTSGSYSGKVTLSASGKNVEVNISGTATAAAREIVWNVADENTAIVNKMVADVLTAYAKTECVDPAGDVTYTVAPEGAATIDGTSVTFTQAGTITITAATLSSDLYGAATSVTKTWKVSDGYIFSGTGTWDEITKWEGDQVPTDNQDIIVTGHLTIDGDREVNSLTIEGTGSVTLVENGTLTINGTSKDAETYGDLHVKEGGNVILTAGQLKVNDFILDAELGSTNDVSTTPSASGQVNGEDKLNVLGDAYFRLTLDPSGRNTLGWYDFVLPFEVDVIGGISMEGDDTPLVFDVNYAVMNYTEAKRAQNGKDWNKYRGTMEPGRVYTIGVDDDYDWNTVIFKKKAGAAVTGDRSFTTEYSGLAADDKDNGWNGFGNGTLHHTELNVPDGTYVQIYDHANRCYRPHLAKDYSIAVGASFFMQVDGVETISLLTIDNKNHGFLAPARTDRNVEKFQLALQAEGAANVADQLWVSASEEATGKYVIGRDLLKMGNPTESKVARMWSTRNDTRLCVNEMTLSNGVANCELSLFAPETKEYTLSVEAAPEEATLYLTYNNRVIWNLSYAPYVFDLSKGTTEGYGLRLVAEAPQMHTDIDETGADAQGVKKVMIDNVLYLVTPQGAMYDINGKIIK